MFLLLIFSFLAGIMTILSPCILPVLPALLSAGTEKGNKRPLGIVSGLVLSFTFFTLFLTTIVRATGISANLVQGIAIFIIFFFGLMMIFPRLSSWFASVTSPIANIGQKIQSNLQKTGLIGGFIFGAALGLVWTPCAGPILAAIITLVAIQEVNLSVILLTFAYSIGAGIPMLVIAYGGKRFLPHTERVKRFFGGIIILTAVSIAFNWDMILQQKIIRYLPPVLIEDVSLVKTRLENLRGEQADEASWMRSRGTDGTLTIYGEAPEITGIVNWINSPPLSLKQLRGKVVMIDFWTYSCINCLRTLPYLTQWYEDYKDQGFVIIGVHTPEFEFEKDPINVANAATRLGVDYPIAQDNDYKTWRAYRNRYWPAHYLIDQQGTLRMVHFGEGKYVETENAIRHLLGLQPLTMEEPFKSTRPISPETYLGWFRAKRYTSENKIKPDQTASYDYTQALEDDQVGLKGTWKIEGERITAIGDDCTIDCNFLATHVYLVMSGSSQSPVEVILDGKFDRRFIVNTDRKYDIVQTTYGRHQVSIKFPPGISAYAFTFGDESSTHPN